MDELTEQYATIYGGNMRTAIKFVLGDETVVGEARGKHSLCLYVREPSPDTVWGINSPKYVKYDKPKRLEEVYELAQEWLDNVAKFNSLENSFHLHCLINDKYDYFIIEPINLKPRSL